MLQYGMTMQVIQQNPARDVIVPRKQPNIEKQVRSFFRTCSYYNPRYASSGIN